MNTSLTALLKRVSYNITICNRYFIALQIRKYCHPPPPPVKLLRKHWPAQRMALCASREIISRWQEFLRAEFKSAIQHDVCVQIFSCIAYICEDNYMLSPFPWLCLTQDIVHHLSGPTCTLTVKHAWLEVYWHGISIARLIAHTAPKATSVRSTISQVTQANTFSHQYYSSNQGTLQLSFQSPLHPFLTELVYYCSSTSYH